MNRMTHIDLPIDGYVSIDDVQVVGGQGTSVIAPTDGLVVDAECRASVSEIISRLEAHGLISDE